MKYSACRECGTKKNLSPLQELNRWVGALSTELRELMVSKAILLVSRILRSANCILEMLQCLVEK